MDDPDGIAEMSPQDKRELLARLLRDKAAQSRTESEAAGAPIPRVPRNAILPLSFAQERIWFLHQLQPGSAAYHICNGLRMSGPLDARLLETCFHQVIGRHETLRTTFQAAGGQPMQQISAATGFRLALIDLQDTPPARRDLEARRVAAELAQKPFDLARDTLLRAALLRLAPDEHIVISVMHHIISDAWSIVVLLLEIVATYRALSEGRVPKLPEMPVQYADFAAWQRKWLQGPALDRQLAYWRGKLAGVTGILELPTDKPRPAFFTVRGDRHAFTVSSDLTEGLESLSRTANSTLQMTLLAAYAVLLMRYTGQEDIVIGSAVSNRPRPELEPLIGLFVNTLPLRIDLSGEATFRQLLERTRETALEAYAHQDLPFERLVEHLELRRDLTRTPLFQTMFAFPQGPIRAFEMPGRTLSVVDVHNGAAKFDLMLVAVKKDGALQLYLEYKTDLFERETIVRMGEHFVNLLTAFIENPNDRIAGAALLSAGERQLLIERFNDTAAVFPENACVHELFEEQAAKTPETVAVICGGRTMTFDELNRRANRLARRLRRSGAAPEVLVGILMERCPEMVTAVLGTLKAGSAYVPIDPSYPPERLRFLLEDSQAKVVITQSEYRHALPSTGAEVILLDAETDFAGEDDSNPQSGAGPQNLAYVMYTSGSTGKPKGAMIEHRGLTNYVWWVRERLWTERVRHIPMVTKLSFDASIKQLFGPLLRGQPVWIIPQETVAQPQALLEELAAKPGVALNCVPSLWRSILDVIETRGCTGDRAPVTTLLIGGEALDRKLVERSFRHFPDLEVINIYGPAEASANTSTARISPGGRITIGHPIANTRTYILGKDLQPMPLGVPGELWIGGVPVSRGYWRRSELTAERFLPDPFSKTQGARMYKSGDLARWLPSGEIEFIGRLDFQVKVRGFRLEPREIEEALLQHPAVRQTAVVALPDASAENRLVAYLSAEDGASPAASELRAFLKDKLPEYMIPGVFVHVAALPLMANGKVDLKALPAPATTRPELQSSYVAPQTEMEKRVAAVWEEVLQIDRVGIDDNFFELGGHSLLAVQVQNRLQLRLNRDFSVIEVFQCPTVRVLARHLEQQEPQPPVELEQRWDQGKERLALLRARSKGVAG